MYVIISKVGNQVASTAAEANKNHYDAHKKTYVAPTTNINESKLKATGNLSVRKYSMIFGIKAFKVISKLQSDGFKEVGMETIIAPAQTEKLNSFFGIA